MERRDFRDDKRTVFTGKKNRTRTTDWIEAGTYSEPIDSVLIYGVSFWQVERPYVLHGRESISAGGAVASLTLLAATVFLFKAKPRCSYSGQPRGPCSVMRKQKPSASASHSPHTRLYFLTRPSRGASLQILSALFWGSLEFLCNHAQFAHTVWLQPRDGKSR